MRCILAISLDDGINILISACPMMWMSERLRLPFAILQNVLQRLLLLLMVSWVSLTRAGSGTAPADASVLQGVDWAGIVARTRRPACCLHVAKHVGTAGRASAVDGRCCSPGMPAFHIWFISPAAAAAPPVTCVPPIEAFVENPAAKIESEDRQPEICPSLGIGTDRCHRE